MLETSPASGSWLQAAAAATRLRAKLRPPRGQGSEFSAWLTTRPAKAGRKLAAAPTLVWHLEAARPTEGTAHRSVVLHARPVEPLKRPILEAWTGLRPWPEFRPPEARLPEGVGLASHPGYRLNRADELERHATRLNTGLR